MVVSPGLLRYSGTKQMTCAVIFPGQGSQSIGMLNKLPEAFHETKAYWMGLASDVLGYDVAALIESGPEETLNQTAHTQPVLLTANQIMWSVWRSQHPNLEPVALAGHSLGEFSALVAAESLAFEEAVALVANRGRLMQEAVPEGTGTMAAILGLPDDVVEAICREVAEGEVVAPANYNSPGQLVIAGDAAAVERAMLQAKAAGAKRAMILPVSVPSHCALMAQAGKELGKSLENISLSLPKFPVFHNVDASTKKTIESIREALVEQLAMPVQWTKTMKALIYLGVDHFYECGPGRVLTGLGRRIDKEVTWVAYEQEVGE